MQPKGDPQAEEELDGTKKRRSHLIEGGGGGGVKSSLENYACKGYMRKNKEVGC